MTMEKRFVVLFLMTATLLLLAACGAPQPAVRILQVGQQPGRVLQQHKPQPDPQRVPVQRAVQQQLAVPAALVRKEGKARGRVCRVAPEVRCAGPRRAGA